MKIAYYITAHGYGHGTRSCDIIAAINRLAPDAEVFIVSDLPEDFLRARISGPQNHFRKCAFDSGMFQLDSVRVNLARSLAEAAAIQSRRPELLAQERDFLRREKIAVVAADIPAIPLEAAKLEKIRAVAVGNFGWDWIYEDFVAREPRWRSVVESFRRAYSQTDLLLKLPFAEPMAAFPRQKQIPLVSSPGKNRRDEIAKLFGISPAKPWALLSFTSLDWTDAALARVTQMTGFEFFTVMPLEWPERKNLHAVDRHAVPFGDVLASADVVVSKPGYGILSECVVNDKPFVYVERADFREYPVLEAAIKRHLRGVHMPSQKLYAGDIEEFLHAALLAPPPAERIPAGGAEIAAAELLGPAARSAPPANFQ